MLKRNQIVKAAIYAFYVIENTVIFHCHDFQIIMPMLELHHVWCVLRSYKPAARASKYSLNIYLAHSHSLTQTVSHLDGPDIKEAAGAVGQT